MKWNRKPRINKKMSIITNAHHFNKYIWKSPVPREDKILLTINSLLGRVNKYKEYVHCNDISFPLLIFNPYMDVRILENDTKSFTTVNANRKPISSLFIADGNNCKNVVHEKDTLLKLLIKILRRLLFVAWKFHTLPRCL